ncbi:hypothetical protein FPSE_05270 [Fusarium pseudograminearum CS3096]|uniref:Uncharacterized protein n=1 Tax=Fusarium pseudograminearum (strain CS3096) TaxID=1028729 RepID=K3W0P7_FUSPC|nr:hypothetical protein FPSE_05270 [Fusarium pseudograminearum CS3096]EKJ74520.1 hypothetical protein FPSE_05270 [Fusarium pseudograminearum CS3096]
MPPITRRKKASQKSPIVTLKYRRGPKTQRKPTRTRDHSPAKDEYYRILAYVKWGVDNNLDFKHDACPMIKSAQFSTYQQLRNKLYREWRKTYANRGGGKFSCLYENGLESLDLNEDELAKIEAFYKDIPSPDALKCIKDSHDENDSDRRTTDFGLPITESNTASTVGGLDLQPSLLTIPLSTQDIAVQVAGSAQPNGTTIPPNIVTLQRPSVTQIPCKSAMNIKTSESELENEITSCKARELELETEVIRLKAREFDLENEIARLKNEYEGLRSTCSNPVDAEVRHILQKQAKLDHRFAQREKKFDPDDPSMSKDHISDRFHVLFHRIQDTCSNVVNSWSHKAFRSELNKWRGTPAGGSMTVENLTVGLVGAAVIDLVFQPAFPDILSTRSVTANLYREFILRWGGAESLQKADFHMFGSLMENRKKTIIDVGAAEIADRIAKQLQQFQEPQHQHAEGWKLNDNGATIIYKDVKSSSFMDMLRRALNLKAEMTESASRLRFMYFMPGQHFEGIYMKRCSGSDDSISRIKACLFPALFLAAGTVGSDEQVLQYNAEYNTYFTELLVGYIPFPSTLVAKAMVLT